MLDKNVVKSWFVTKAKPVQNQFAQWIDASWFKGEQLAISDVNGLSDALLQSQVPIASTIALLNATDDFATFAASQSTIIVKDQIRGGVFIKYTGADAVDDGRIFQDANSNKWKRQTQDEKINVAWYGIVGDGTDESAKIQAMFDALSGVVHLVWNNKTYRFYGVQVASTITDLTLEFNGTTFCYPLRNGTPATNMWYRFSDAVGKLNFQLQITNVPRIALKGSLLLDGEKRLGNTFNTLNSTGGIYGGIGLAPVISVVADKISVNQILPGTLTPVTGASTLVGGTGFNVLTSSTGITAAYIQFTNRRGYKTRISYNLDIRTGKIGHVWNNMGLVNYTAKQGYNAVYVPSTEGYKLQSIKIFIFDPTNVDADITDILVEEISLDYLDTHLKTEGQFKIIDHGFSAFKVESGTDPAYNLIDLKDWHWFKTVFGGMQVQGNHNVVKLSNFTAYDPEARSFEQAIFGGDNARGISVSPPVFEDPTTWAKTVEVRNFNMNYCQGYITIYAFKKLLLENTTFKNWGNYVGGDGVVRRLGETTGSGYDLPIAVGGPQFKIDPTYWSEDFLLIFRNVNTINTSMLIKNGGKWFSAFWIQSGVKNSIIENCKFDANVAALGKGDYDPTSQSWAFGTTFRNCEFTEESTQNTGIGIIAVDCKWTRLRQMKSATVDYPFPSYTNLKECITFGPTGNPDNTKYGTGDAFGYNLFTRCTFVARSFNINIVFAKAVFRDCIFQDGSAIPLYGSYGSVPAGEKAHDFDFQFFNTKRITINFPILQSSTNKAVNLAYFENSEIIIEDYTGVVADLESASTKIRKIFDSSTYRWNNLKIYDVAGNLLHDLKGFEWLTEPTSTASYGLEGAYYETATKRYDYKSGSWVIKNKSNTLSASATLDFPSIAASASADLTIALTGAALGDTINIGLPASAPVGLVFNAFVSAADVVTLRATNVTALPIDADSATYKVTVVKTL